MLTSERPPDEWPTIIKLLRFYSHGAYMQTLRLESSWWTG